MKLKIYFLKKIKKKKILKLIGKKDFKSTGGQT